MTSLDPHAVARAAGLLATDPARAEKEARRLLLEAPNDPRVLLVVGSARRRLNDPEAACAVLLPLTASYPRAVRTLYEYGLTLAALAQTPAAVAALRRATELDRDFADAWRALGDLLFAEGDGEGAERAYAEHQRALIDDPRLKAAAEALISGDDVTAERRLRASLASAGESAAALQMLAAIFNRRGLHADAEVLLARALELEPSSDGVRFDYANALFRQQKAVDAQAQVDLLMARAPDDPAYRNLAAACLGMIGDAGRVNLLYEGLLADFPKQSKIWLNQAHALRTAGRRDEAIAAYRRCIALAPHGGDAYWGLANLKVAAFTQEEVSAMLALLESPRLGREDRWHLHYALGKAFEDQGQAAAAFDHYATGARLRRATATYDAQATTAQMRRTRAVFTADALAARHAGAGSEAPIFVVGLPRSGSTLVEQILASHSRVEGTMELPHIGLIARTLERERGGYPEVLTDLSQKELVRLGERYLTEARPYRRLGREFFIDKMPNNFAHVGLIHLILPRAKIIDVRRHPMATGFSVFKQHFDQGQTFSYDLDDIARYYRDYVQLMAHFDDVLPDRVHRVIYEDLVDDTEAQVRRLLDYCGLTFEASCMAFHTNSRAVRTVSSEQVRRPIFREALDQWRRFEPWLGPLRDALGSTLDDWRGGAPAA